MGIASLVCASGFLDFGETPVAEGTQTEEREEKPEANSPSKHQVKLATNTRTCQCTNCPVFWRTFPSLTYTYLPT